MEKHKTELSEKSGDVEMNRCVVEGSICTRNDMCDSVRKIIGIEIQDQTEVKAGGGSLGANGADDQADNADEVPHCGQSEPNMKPCEADNTNLVSTQVENNSDLKVVPSDSVRNDGGTVGQDSAPQANASSDDNCTLSAENGAAVIEGENVVDNIGADKYVRKRNSEIDSADGASQTKRMRVGNCYNEKSEELSQCDKRNGNVFTNGADKATGLQKQREENAENFSVVGKESGDDKKRRDTEKEVTDKEARRDIEVVYCSSKRAHQPVGFIVRSSPKMLEQLKLSEGKNNSAERAPNEVKERQEPPKSIAPVDPKSNMDLGSERVAKRTIDGSEIAEPSEPAPRLKPSPSLRDIHQDLVKKLSRSDLEEFVVQKLSEVFPDSRTFGELHQKCQLLEQTFRQWREKTERLQSQVNAIELRMERHIRAARTTNERLIPVKVSRTVGQQTDLSPLCSAMLSNRIPSNDSQMSLRHVRREDKKVSPPRAAAPVQLAQQQPQQHQQQGQTEQTVVTPASNSLRVETVASPGFTNGTPTPGASEPVVAPKPITPLQLSSSPQKVVAVPTSFVAISLVTAAAPLTRTVNTVNNTAVNTATNMRVVTSLHQQPKPSSLCPPNKQIADTDIIDLTEGDDRDETMQNIATVNATPPTTIASSTASSSVTTPVCIRSSTRIQTGRIPVVEPHQLLGASAKSIFSSSSAAFVTSRTSYFVSTSARTVQRRRMLVTACMPSQFRPDVTYQQSPVPALPFKNGIFVPIQQVSRTVTGSTTAILRTSPPVQASQQQQVMNPTSTGQEVPVISRPVTTVGRMTPPATSTVNSVTGKHPAPLPDMPTCQPSDPSWKCPPPKPELKISQVIKKEEKVILLTWNMQLTSEHEQIASYQLYAYEETFGEPNCKLWKEIGVVTAQSLPMSCTLERFIEGRKYHFAIRAVDVHTRVGPFSTPEHIVYTLK
jgi:hypothetical protein